MKKFYCPVCNDKDAKTHLLNSQDAMGIPSIVNGDTVEKNYLLSYLCCCKCNTVLSTIATEFDRWTKG